MDNRPIGIFDSGLGGLTVVREIKRLLPNESVVYFGDTARIPYGTRSREIVTKYSIQCINFLLSKDIKTIVIACNTASSSSLEAVRDIFDIPIIGVIEPGARMAVRYTKNNRIGIIGTQGTIRSRAYFKAIHDINDNIKIYEQACSLFVPIVEEGWSDTEIARLTTENYLKEMKDEKIDTILLGCTHFPLLSDTIRRVMGDGVSLVNPAVETAVEVRRVLEDRDILRMGLDNPQYMFYVSDFGQKFEAIGSQFLNQRIECVEKIDIEEFS